MNSPRSSPSGGPQTPPTDSRSAAWRPTPLLRASAALHAAALLGLAAAPSERGRILRRLAANHVLVALTGMHPRAPWIGPVLHRLPSKYLDAVALTFDDGPDPEITPRVLDLLDGRGAKATFFVIGERAVAHPRLTRDIVARGHRVENHTFHHRHTFAFQLYPAMLREIRQAQDAIADVTGRAPRYFRAPAGMRNVFVDPVLHRLGLRLVAWTRRGYDAVESRTDRVLPRLCRGLTAGDVLLMHDGNAARGADGRAGILETLPRLLALLERRGLRSVPLPDELEPAPIEGAADLL